MDGGTPTLLDDRSWLDRPQGAGKIRSSSFRRTDTVDTQPACCWAVCVCVCVCREAGDASIARIFAVGWAWIAMPRAPSAHIQLLLLLLLIAIMHGGKGFDDTAR